VGKVKGGSKVISAETDLNGGPLQMKEKAGVVVRKIEEKTCRDGPKWPAPADGII